MASPSDVVVVGAGVIGCAIAYELARRGASIDIVDDRPAGMGATQASAGMLAPYLEARDEGPLLDLTARSLGLFDEFVDEVSVASGVSIRYERTGTLDVALTEGACRALRGACAVLESRGVRAEWLDATDVRAREPLLSEQVLGGLLIPVHGYIAARQFTNALETAMHHRGVRSLERARATRIARSRPGLVVETDRGPHSARTVVLAGGSWSGQVEIEGVMGGLPVRPVRGQLLELKWAGPSLRQVVWGERCYVVPWQDGTALVGATVEDVGFDERTTVAGVRELMDAVCEILPRAESASLIATRAGLRPGTPDGLPIIGASTVLPNLIYATGHYRNGILLAPLTARLVADLVLDGRADPMLAAVAPGRFGAI